jgi:hypothetical protein
MTVPSPAPVPGNKPADPKPAVPTAPPKAPSLFWSKMLRRPDRLTSIAFTLPVFLLYHLGILLVDRRSQIDFISTLMLRLLDASVPAYVLTTLALALVLLLIVWVQQKRGAVPPSSFGRVIGESAFFAVTILMGLGWATHQLARAGEASDATAATGLRVFDKLVLAAGSGFHEEFIFRALLISGGLAVLSRVFGRKPRSALITRVSIMIASSIAFALAQHFVIYGDPFSWSVAGYRVLEGLVFAMLYVSRGFAVAVYTHAFYEALAFFVYS